MIDKGFYSHSSDTDNHSRYMCLSVKYHGRDMLTDSEVKKALGAIDNYIYTVLCRDSEQCTLCEALEKCGYKNDVDALVAVYRNWAKRPNLRIQRNL